MKAINIKWDVDFDKDLKDLPKEIDIPSEITDVEEISDYLTEQTGFCHKGFELVYPQDKKTESDTENTGNRLVKFVDLFEENNMIPRYGILLPDKTIICFCCGGVIEPEDYVILEDNIPWQYLDETTRKCL